MVENRYDCSLCLVFVLILALFWMPADRTLAQDSNPDFWWDVGEADKEHTTYAPADVRELSRQNTVSVQTFARKRSFVGDEPVQIRYRIAVPFHVRIATENFQQRMPPFVVTSLHVGRRFAVPKIKDLERLQVTVTLRLPAGNDYGTYTVPPLKIPYEYDVITTIDRHITRETVSAAPVALEKVPLSVATVQQHDTGFIGDPFAVGLEIHLDHQARILNEDPPDIPQRGIVYLADYAPQSPFVLLKQQRTETLAQDYQVIRWQYTVAVHDISDQPFKLQMPPVIWRHDQGNNSLPLDNKQPEQTGSVIVPDRDPVIHTFNPEPVSFMIRSITRDIKAFKPHKSVRPEPGAEKTLLLTVPRLVLMMCAGILFLGLLAQGIRLLMRRQHLAEPVPDGGKAGPSKPVYDKWPWQRFSLQHQLRKTREAFQENPAAHASALRLLLGRLAALRLPPEERPSIQEASAMTAAEFRQLVGDCPEILELEELDRRLETERYRSLAGSGEGEG
jgi:hypothetical protein